MTKAEVADLIGQIPQGLDQDDFLVALANLAAAKAQRRWVGLEDEDVLNVGNDFNRGALWAEHHLRRANT